MDNSSNTKLPNKYKSYVGRLFKLKNKSNIHTSTISYASSDPYTKSIVPRKDFGNVIFVIDESNTRIRCFTAQGKAVWIPKYNLAEELILAQEAGIDNKEEKYSEVVQILINVIADLQSNGALDIIEKTKLSSACEKAIDRLRSLWDQVK